ncbi:MAG TPA: arylesterase [Pyrinomonadaceae bacterium]|jgi:acyl-CoA thioesterase-1
MQAVSKFSRVVCVFISFLLLSFTSILGSCSASPYTFDEINYIKSVKPKTEKPLIIAFGDSLTSGFTLDKNLSYPHLLEERLNARNCPHEVLNFGINGDTTGRAVTRVDDALNFERVRLFILELGANDVAKNADVARTKANLQEIISDVKRKNVKILLCGYEAPAASSREYRDAVRQMYADLAAENDVPLLPSFLSGVGGDANLMLPDEIHPNEKGIKIIERNVFEKIEPLLECK